MNISRISIKLNLPGSLFAVTALLCPALTAGTIAPDLEKITPGSRSVTVLIRYKATAGTRSPVAPFGSATKAGNAGDFEIWNCTAAEARAIAASPTVDHIALNHDVLATATPVAVYDYLPETVQKSVRDGDAADPKKGKGIGIALIDSGVNVNADLLGERGNVRAFSRVVYSESFVPGELARVDDQYGHGTHIAGIIAGDASNSFGPNYTHTIKGVAPGADIINLRVLDKNGATTDALVIQAIERAIELKNIYNIRIINLSLGRPVFESFRQDPLDREVEKAWLNGITVVVAAGNSGRYSSTSFNARTQGYSSITAPGNDPIVITVGAMNTESTANRIDDLMTTYSSKGPTLGDHVVKPDFHPQSGFGPGNRR